MLEIPAADYNQNCIITASHVIAGSYAGGFDCDELSYMRIFTEEAVWAKIDLTESVKIKCLRFRGGPDDPSNTSPQTIEVSTDDSNWTTIASFIGQEYYSVVSPWFPVGMNVRYIKYTREASNWVYLRYMGIVLSDPVDHKKMFKRNRNRFFLNNPITKGDLERENLVWSYFQPTHDCLNLQPVSGRPAVFHTHGENFLTGGVATASSSESGHPPSHAVDGNLSTRWNNYNAMPSWWKYDLGAGNEKIIKKLRLYKVSYDQLAGFVLSGSNDDTAWTCLFAATMPTGLNVWREWDIPNYTAYRYYRLYMRAGYGESWVSIGECEMME